MEANEAVVSASPLLRVSLFYLGPLNSDIYIPPAAVLKSTVIVPLPGYSKAALVSLCMMRCVERHNAVVRFVQFFPAIIQALDTLEQVNDPDTYEKADILRRRKKEIESVVSNFLFRRRHEHRRSAPQIFRPPIFGLATPLVMTLINSTLIRFYCRKNIKTD